MFSKRLIAKIIDLLILSIVGGTLIIALGITFDTVLELGVVDRLVVMQESIAAVSSDVDAVNTILEENLKMLYGISIFSSILTLVFAILYFGFFGKMFSGSVGKKLIGLKVEMQNTSMLTYIKREPAIHILTLSVILLLISYFVSNALLFDVFSFVYLIFFAMGNDYWNTITRSKVVFANQVSYQEVVTNNDVEDNGTMKDE